MPGPSQTRQRVNAQNKAAQAQLDKLMAAYAPQFQDLATARDRTLELAALGNAYGSGGGGGSAPAFRAWEEDPGNLILQAQRTILQRGDIGIDKKSIKKQIKLVKQLKKLSGQQYGSQVRETTVRRDSDLMRALLQYNEDERKRRDDYAGRGATASAGNARLHDFLTAIYGDTRDTTQKLADEALAQLLIGKNERNVGYSQQLNNLRTQRSHLGIDEQMLTNQDAMREAQRAYAAEARAYADANRGGGSSGESYQNAVRQLKLGYGLEDIATREARLRAQIVSNAASGKRGYAGQRPGPG